MTGYTEFDKLKVYTAERTKLNSAEVERVLLTEKEARELGWHFRRKSKGRMRITGYTGGAGDLTIPAEIGGYTVNEIGKDAFRNSGVLCVYLPQTVKKLGAGCFAGSAVKKAVFADGLKEIPESTFSECRQLCEVHLPQTLETIREDAFSRCTALTFIDIPMWCLHIMHHAFFGSGLRELKMPVNNVFVYGSAFDETPLPDEYDIILTPKDYYDRIDVLLMGSKPKNIKFPKKRQVFFCKRSLPYSGSYALDLSDSPCVYINSQCFVKEDPLYYYCCITLKMPCKRQLYDLPDYVNTNRYNDRLVKLKKNRNAVIELSLSPSLLGEHAIDSSYLREIRFNEVKAVRDKPLEIFSDHCSRLHTVSWVEKGIRYTKHIPTGQDGLWGAFYSKDLHKAFKADREGLKFDRGVLDKAFRNMPDRNDDCLLTVLDRAALAVDVLRSTPMPDEGSTEMYTKFLDCKRGTILKKMHNLPEVYVNFLREYYGKK